MNLFLFYVEAEDGRRYYGVLEANDGAEAGDILLKKLPGPIERYDLVGVTSKTFTVKQLPSSQEGS